MPKHDKIETDKRIRIVKEWLIDDWSYGDIIAQIKIKWDIDDRQAKRYIAKAREEWNEDEDEKMEQKRRRKINKLQKLVRSLKEEHKGTPAGIRAVMSVEKEIILLEGMRKPTKVSITDSDGNDVPMAVPEIKVYAGGPPLARSEEQIA